MFEPVTPSSDELGVHVTNAIDALRSKWTSYTQTLIFKADVPLSKIIEIFMVPAREYVISTYPEFSTAPDQIVWMMVFTAVMESGTHSKDAVNEAVAELQAKFAWEPRNIYEDADQDPDMQVEEKEYSSRSLGMNRFYPHIYFFSVLISFSIFGIVMNYTPMAAFLGSFLAMLTDPLLVLGALCIGAIFQRWILLLVAIVFAIALSMFIDQTMAPLGATSNLSPFVVFVRIVAVIGVAYIANAVRILVTNNNKNIPKSS